jgi:hypothetical protein
MSKDFEIWRFYHFYLFFRHFFCAGREGVGMRGKNGHLPFNPGLTSGTKGHYPLVSVDGSNRDYPFELGVKPAGPYFYLDRD